MGVRVDQTDDGRIKDLIINETSWPHHTTPTHDHITSFHTYHSRVQYSTVQTYCKHTTHGSFRLILVVLRPATRVSRIWRLLIPTLHVVPKRLPLSISLIPYGWGLIIIRTWILHHRGCHWWTIWNVFFVFFSSDLTRAQKRSKAFWTLNRWYPSLRGILYLQQKWTETIHSCTVHRSTFEKEK